MFLIPLGKIVLSLLLPFHYRRIYLYHCHYSVSCIDPSCYNPNTDGCPFHWQFRCGLGNHFGNSSLVSLAFSAGALFCTLIEMISMSDVECSFGCHKGTSRTLGLLLALTLCSSAADIGGSRFFQSFMRFCKSIVYVTCCFLVRIVRPT